VATVPQPQPQPTDFNIDIDIIQAGMSFAISMTVDDRKGLTSRLILAAPTAEQFAKAILVAVEQSKTKIIAC
jgi:hypothetical protein